MLPVDLKKENWEKVKKTIPEDLKKEGAVLDALLVTLRKNVDAIDIAAIEAAPEKAFKAATVADAQKAGREVEADLAKVPKLKADVEKVQAQLKKLFSGGFESPAAEKMHKASVDFKKWVEGYAAQTAKKIENAITTAENKAKAAAAALAAKKKALADMIARVEAEKATANELTLDKILADAAVLAEFHKACVGFHNDEQLDFVLEMRGGKGSQEIFNRFVADGAKDLINIEKKEIEAVRKAVAQGEFEGPAWQKANDEMKMFVNMDCVIKWRNQLRAAADKKLALLNPQLAALQ
jgi:hypothetical protein